MEHQEPARRLARFAQFELDLHTGELRKAGRQVRMGGQPLRILELLLDRGGDLVTREEIRAALWADDTFVDFEHSLNSAMKRLRAALGDHADSPRFVETVPRRGYRLLVPVTWQALEPMRHQGTGQPVGSGPTSPAAADEGAGTGQPVYGRSPAGTPWLRWAGVAIAAVASLSALALWGSRAPESPRSPSIAVLPFEIAGPPDAESADQYLAFGLADALITELARADGLRVTSHTTSVRYRDSGKALPVIARELGVDVVVEGAVLRDGDRIRATVQVIDARTDGHIWAHSFDHAGEPVFAFATDVARAVADQVQRRLLPAASATTVLPPVDPRVTEAFLRGRYHLSRGIEVEFARARTYFEAALALDPTHAPSHSGLADFYVINDSLPPAESLPLAREHAQRAIALDPRLADAHVSLGYARYYGDWDWAGAEAAFRYALALDADHVRAHRWYAILLATIGRVADADEHMSRALALDPVAMVNHDAAAALHFHARRFEEAARVGRAMLDLDAFDVRGYEHVALASMQLGRPVEALQALDTALVYGPGPLLQALRAMALGRLGRIDDAGAILDGLMADVGAARLPEVIHAIARAALGQDNLALDALDRAYAQRDPYLVLLRVTAWFDPLREDPRYQQLVERLAFPPTAG
jgi:TolB-like protein/DNA-binding winged helix-turn-helix (wHTH) protein/tetratricopeptide (TPR) repeat protein